MSRKHSHALKSLVVVLILFEFSSLFGSLQKYFNDESIGTVNKPVNVKTKRVESNRTKQNKSLETQHESEERPSVGNTISPACLPFVYYNSSNSNTSREFYEEIWSRKPVQRPTIIKFLHMRKAGGTSLHRYFAKQVIPSSRTSFTKLEHCEGNKRCLGLNHYEDGYHKYYDDEGNTTIQSVRLSEGKTQLKQVASQQWDNSGKTFYVTHLREPVARALSNYKYNIRCNGKWGKSVRHPIMTLPEFVEKPNLNEWIDPIPSRSSLWECSANCYARWATGMYHPLDVSLDPKHPSSFKYSSEFMKKYPNVHRYFYENNDRENHKARKTEFGNALSEEALKLLLRYDLIIVLEWLHTDPVYAKTIEDVFFGGVRGISNRTDAYCNNLSMEEFDTEASRNSIGPLRENNAIDQHLYETLTSCKRL